MRKDGFADSQKWRSPKAIKPRRQSPKIETAEQGKRLV
jgi:hypothetical protein